MVNSNLTKLALYVLSIAAAPAQAINVVQSNDDGWAEINIRQQYYSLTDAGFNSFISAPAVDRSGTGSSDAPPTTVGSNGCEFGSCPAGSPAVGKNESMPRFNYVNSYPVTAMRYGIQHLASTFFGNGIKPDIAVSGFNVGANLGVVTQFSGTVGAACEAVRLGVPAIAFSGSTGTQTAWNASVEGYVQTYATLATTVTRYLTAGEKPYLPRNVWLNVNFPPSNSTTCRVPLEYQFVLSRIHDAVPRITPSDVVTCNNKGRLPTETEVINTPGCYASISVGSADTKLDACAAEQEFVLGRLGVILGCLPSK